jgi:hypothetical protein
MNPVLVHKRKYVKIVPAILVAKLANSFGTVANCSSNRYLREDSLQGFPSEVSQFEWEQNG